MPRLSPHDDADAIADAEDESLATAHLHVHARACKASITHAYFGAVFGNGGRPPRIPSSSQ
jgi:hypothetical protein